MEAKGFSKLVQTGLSLQVNQQAQLDLTLKVGAQTETVEVVSQAHYWNRSLRRLAQ